MVEGPKNYVTAVNDFRNARRRAKMQSLASRVSGRSDELLSFDEVSKQLNLTGIRKRYLAEIPLDSIVGSVGRYQDFNRKFLPLSDSDQHRWADVMMAQEKKGLPPIEVYKIGKAYFVVDGNHRVSIARQMGSDSIEANVTEYQSKVVLTPEDDIDDILIKAEQTELLKNTKLDEIRPDLEFEITVPGRNRELFEHIIVHKYYLGIERGRDVSMEEAVNSWVENVYLPVIMVIREKGILRDFPDRTETDLYLWLKKHQLELADSLGWEVGVDKAAGDLVKRFSPNFSRVVTKFKERVLDAITPDELEAGPPPGEWRCNLVPRRDDRLFSAILVSMSAHERNWIALEQALPIAKHEDAVLRGLHVVRNEKDVDSENVKKIKEMFYWRCGEEGVKGEFAVEVGDVARKTVQRSVWSDLLILHLFHPPGLSIASRYRSGIRTILHRCPRPVLAVPNISEKVDRVLLAFDGSPKSEEALFLSSYLGCYWGSQIIVVGSTEGKRAQEKTLSRAKEYLEGKGIGATYVEKTGPAGKVILDVARENRADIIAMGGYGSKPIVDVVAGSTVNHILREFDRPILICR